MNSASLRLRRLYTLALVVSALFATNLAKAEQTKFNTLPADDNTMMRLMAVYSPPVVQQKTSLKLPQLKRELIDKKVVLVGEIHNQFEQHVVQLGVLKHLHEQNPKIGIGIEWIQSHFQPVLDQFMNSEITELELLKLTEFDSRWGYDYRMFRPILSYAKTHKIPVFALSTPQEINKKYADKGMSGLTELEKSYITPHVEPTTDEHLMMMEEHFSQYFSDLKKINRMVKINRLWESTMSHLTLKPLQSNQVNQMLVFTGINHISDDMGMVNDLSHRLPRDQIATISVQTKETLNRDLTDYVVVSPPLYVRDPKQVMFAKQ